MNKGSKAASTTGGLRVMIVILTLLRLAVHSTLLILHISGVERTRSTGKVMTCRLVTSQTMLLNQRRRRTHQKCNRYTRTYNCHSLVTWISPRTPAFDCRKNIGLGPIKFGSPNVNGKFLTLNDLKELTSASLKDKPIQFHHEVESNIS